MQELGIFLLEITGVIFFITMSVALFSIAYDTLSSETKETLKKVLKRK